MIPEVAPNLGTLNPAGLAPSVAPVEPEALALATLISDDFVLFAGVKLRDEAGGAGAAVVDASLSLIELDDLAGMSEVDFEPNRLVDG